MKKRFLSILLSLAMVLTMIPFATMTAFADQASYSLTINTKALQKNVDLINKIKTVEDICSITPSEAKVANSEIWFFQKGHSGMLGAKYHYRVNEQKWIDVPAYLTYVEPTEVDLSDVDFAIVELIFEGDMAQYNLNLNVNGKSFGENEKISALSYISDVEKDAYAFNASGNLLLYIRDDFSGKSNNSTNSFALGGTVLAVAAGIGVATVGTIATVKAIKNYKAEEASKVAEEEAAKKAAEEEAKRIAELEAAKALVEATALTQNKLVANKNGSIKVSFEASTLDGVVGYEIQRATDKDFTENVKTYNNKKLVRNNSKNLKKGTRYFYRVRAKVELADGSIAYTDWSNTRYIKATKTR